MCSDPALVLCSLMRPRARGAGWRSGPGGQECCDVAPPSVAAQADADGARGRARRRPHRREHVARPDLARRARGTRADGDALEIERDHQRLGAGARQRQARRVGQALPRASAMTTASRRDRADLGLQSLAQRAHALHAGEIALRRLGRGAEPGDGRRRSRCRRVGAAPGRRRDTSGGRLAPLAHDERADALGPAELVGGKRQVVDAERARHRRRPGRRPAPHRCARQGHALARALPPRRPAASRRSRCWPSAASAAPRPPRSAAPSAPAGHRGGPRRRRRRAARCSRAPDLRAGASTEVDARSPATRIASQPAGQHGVVGLPCRRW